MTIDVTDDPTLVREMALAGCTGVFVGFESLNAGNLRDARKRSPVPDDYARRVAILHDNGIQVNGSFVLGFDHDGASVFARTVEWIEQNRLECATFHILTPYPGTPLFDQLARRRRIVHRDWRLYDTAHVVFEPKTHDRRAAPEWLRVLLSAAVFASLDLASAPEGLARGVVIPRDVVPLQAIESDLAFPDPSPADGTRVAATRGAQPPATPALQAPACETDRPFEECVT